MTTEDIIDTLWAKSKNFDRIAESTKTESARRYWDGKAIAMIEAIHVIRGID